MRLSELLRTAGVEPESVSGDAEVTGLTIDSRLARPGSMFVCMPNMTRDSETFVPDAAANGAVAGLAHTPAGYESMRSFGMAACLVPPTGPSFAEAVWRICDAFFDSPTRNITVVGVTGTNGKTTTAWVVRDMLRALGSRAAYLGTLGFHLPDEERALENTTPFAVQLYNLLAEARDEGVQSLAMEVSSHALAERRADGVEFDACVFTNLTQDHLDYHGTMESYASAKLRLFTEIPAQTQKPTVAAINRDDPVGARWLEGPLADARRISFGFGPGADLMGEAEEVRFDRLRLALHFRGERRWADVPLGGAYNAANALAAAAGVLALGYPLEKVASALESVRPVPGRFEPVRNGKGIAVLVDYAHTPDAIEKLLEAARPLAQGKLITVFGCGGDRDRTKRPRMAKAASERSDVTVVTSDNPRTEDPQAILRDVLQGIEPGRESVAILDRPEAVAHAVGIAGPGDLVVIAGKGHENYQIVGRTKFPMDDRELARKALEVK